MRIGILGSGDVAKALAAGFLQQGDEVMLGTRDTGKLAQWSAQAGDRASIGSFADAAEFGEIVLLATLGTATVAAIAQAGAGSFASKVVIDTSNPLNFTQNGPELAWGFDDSNGERVQAALPNARVVKAFNTVGHQLMVHPNLPGGPPTMLIAGNDASAKQTVSALLERWGWESAEIGAITSSRYLEAMCVAWVLYALTNNSWAGHAFKLLHS